jgi:flavorubredoxin
MEPLEIAPGVYDVGVTDWNIRDFHGYSTDLGTTYNAFLIVDQKIALLDTVKKAFADQLLDNISAIVDPKKIDYVISNHTELDHSGGLARVMHRVGEDKPLYCSKMGSKNLPRHRAGPFRWVDSGDAPGWRGQTPVLLKNGQQEPAPPFFSQLELSSRRDRPGAEPGQKNTELSGNPHGPLARQHVYLFKRG